MYRIFLKASPNQIVYSKGEFLIKINECVNNLNLFRFDIPVDLELAKRLLYWNFNSMHAENSVIGKMVHKN